MQRLNDMSTSELIATARGYAGSIKEIGIYSELVKELTTRLAASTAAANEGARHAARADALAVENAYLLPKAASELSNAWVLHKYWVGIQVALMHVREGRLHDGMVWLQNTISGPGIEAPELKEFSEIEAWAAGQQKDSIGHVRALEIIKAETPATDAELADIRNEALVQYANKTGFSFQNRSIHAHFGSGNVMVGSVTFDDGSAGVNFAPVREKLGGVGTDYEWTRGKSTEDVDSVFVISSTSAAGLEVIRNKLDEAIEQLRKESGK